MPINTAMCNTFKQELFQALHNFASGNVFMAAIYSASADLGKNTSQYTPTNEVVGQGYTAGGKQALPVDAQLAGDIAYANFQNVVWPDSSIIGRGCLFYNLTNGNRSVSVHAFDAVRQSINGDFEIVTPYNSGSTALLRLV